MEDRTPRRTTERREAALVRMAQPAPAKQQQAARRDPSAAGWKRGERYTPAAGSERPAAGLAQRERCTPEAGLERPAAGMAQRGLVSAVC